jgi:rubredoxin
MKPNEFRCAACGQVYEKAWTDEEAWAEAEMYWPDVKPEAMTVICNGCWLRGMKRLLTEVRLLTEMYQEQAGEAQA